MAEIKKSDKEKPEAERVNKTVLDSMIATVTDKMRDLATQVLVNERMKMPIYEEKKPDIEPLLKTLIGLDYNKLQTEVEKEITEDTEFFKTAKENEQRTIDYKFVKPLLAETGFAEKTKDFDYLKREEQKIIDKINNLSAKLTTDPEDKSNYTVNSEIGSAKVELAQVHANLRKKQGDVELITKKYTTTNSDPKKVIIGDIIASKWKKDYNEKKKMQDSIEAEKSKEERKIIQETVKDELKKKKEEIDKFRKELMIANYKEGKADDETSKKEKEGYEKKEKPLDSAETIESNLKVAKQQYLDIYGRLGLYYRIQAEITLLSDDLTRKKELKKLIEADKKEKSSIQEKNVTAISRLSPEDRGEIPKKGSTTPELSATYISLKADQDKLQGEIALFTDVINKLNTEIQNYEAYMKILKGIPEKTAADELKKRVTDLIKLRDNVPTKILNVEAPTLVGGDSQTKATLKKRAKAKKEKKTKRLRLREQKHKTLRKWRRLKKYLRKKKRTLRRRLR
jgi:hypothetical protein